MKKSLTILAALVLLCSCGERFESCLSYSEEPAGTITLSIGDATVTKAAATDGEKSINSLCLAVFGADGKLELFRNCNSSDIQTASSDGLQLEVKSGTKCVWAVSNVDASKFSSVTSLNAFRNVALYLADSSPSSLAMKAEVQNLGVEAGRTTAVTLNLERFVSRVSLVKVVNHLPESYGTLRVKSIFLANVVCNDNMCQNAGPQEWCNPLGHGGTVLSAGSVIGNGSVEAKYPELTFRAVGTDVANGSAGQISGKAVYGFRNASQTLPVPRVNGFPEGGCKSVLYVIATIGGTDYWYPVIMDSLVSNYNYNVELTVTMPGQRPEDDDFGGGVTKGCLEVGITVTDWSDGADRYETI